MYIFGFPRVFGRAMGQGTPSTAGLTYLARFEFPTDAGAPLASPYTEGTGSLTIVDTNNIASINGSSLRTNGTGLLAYEDPRIYLTTGLARVAGRSMLFSINTGVALRLPGWRVLQTGGSVQVIYSSIWLSTTAISAWDGAAATALGAVTASTTYQVALVLRATGCFFFIKGGSQFTSWTLAWIFTNATSTPLYPSFQGDTTIGLAEYAYLRVRDLPAPFATDYGIASVNVASPSHLASQTATADQIIDLDVTAPGVLADEAGFRYRILDANNYWRAYFNAAGAFRLDSVAAGVATNRISVAGVIAGGQTRTIRIICEGSLHDAYSFSGTAPTKRGAQISVSHQNTETAIAADIGAGWAVANLRSYPRTAAAYTTELDKV